MASARRVSIGICMPGESFSSAWVSNWTNLFMSLLAGGYDPAPLFGYSSSVFVTRASLALEMMHSSVPIDYLLWFDDDNIVTPEMFQRLKKDLDEHPEADMVAGWSWIEPNAMTGTPAIISCGRLKGYTVDPFDWAEIKRAAAADTLLEAQYTGFPCVLMRYGLLAKAGPNPFAPILGDDLRWGMTGEDLAFCVHARERGGALILVDPKVHVPHLKTAPIPDPVDQFEMVDLAREPVKHVYRSKGIFDRTPSFSLCHCTIRLPDGWMKSCREWYDLADDPDDCEYILCTEEPVEIQRSKVPWKHFKQVSNHGRGTSTSAWNTAGRASKGSVLITVADDLSPCPHWDSEMLKAIPDLKGEYVVEVSMGSNPLLTHSILTRAYYERYQRILYPEYWSMYPDDDFTAVARRDGVVIDARHLVFPHNHPNLGTGHWDKAYAWENRTEAHVHGAAVFEWRKAHNFEDRVKGDGLDRDPVKTNTEALVSAP
jgi:hypothetical protein